MCIRISVVDVCPQLVAWDPASQSIIVRNGTRSDSALAEIRAILTDLDAPVDAPLLLCHCGDPVPLPLQLAAAALTRAPLVRQAVAHGA